VGSWGPNPTTCPSHQQPPVENIAFSAAHFPARTPENAVSCRIGSNCLKFPSVNPLITLAIFCHRVKLIERRQVPVWRPGWFERIGAIRPIFFNGSRHGGSGWFDRKPQMTAVSGVQAGECAAEKSVISESVPRDRVPTSNGYSLRFTLCRTQDRSCR